MCAVAQSAIGRATRALVNWVKNYWASARPNRTQAPVPPLSVADTQVARDYLAARLRTETWLPIRSHRQDTRVAGIFMTDLRRPKDHSIVDEHGSILYFKTAEGIQDEAMERLAAISQHRAKRCRQVTLLASQCGLHIPLIANNYATQPLLLVGGRRAGNDFFSQAQSAVAIQQGPTLDDVDICLQFVWPEGTQQLSVTTPLTDPRRSTLSEQHRSTHGAAWQPAPAVHLQVPHQLRLQVRLHWAPDSDEAQVGVPTYELLPVAPLC